MSAIDRKPAFGRKWWLRLGLWAVVGGVVGYLVADTITLNLPPVSAEQAVALFVAWAYAAPGAMVLAGSLSARLGQAMNMFDDRAAWEDERGMMIQSGLGCLLISLFLLVLLAVEPLGLIGGQAGLALAVACFAIGSWYTWRTWQVMDELWRRVTSDATVVAFYIVFAIGTAWSGLAHLALAQPLGPLGWISLFLAASLGGSIIATGRRGLIRNT